MDETVLQMYKTTKTQGDKDKHNKYEWMRMDYKLQMNEQDEITNWMKYNLPTINPPKLRNSYNNIFQYPK